MVGKSSDIMTVIGNFSTIDIWIFKIEHLSVPCPLSTPTSPSYNHQFEQDLGHKSAFSSN
jgi:hypothetical protein